MDTHYNTHLHFPRRGGSAPMAHSNQTAARKFLATPVEVMMEHHPRACLGSVNHAARICRGYCNGTCTFCVISRRGSEVPALFFQDCCRTDNEGKQMFNVFVFVLTVICLGNSNDSRQNVRATAPLNRKKKAALRAPGPGAAHFCSPLPRWPNEPVV